MTKRPYQICTNCIMDTRPGPSSASPTADILTFKVYYRFVKGIRVVKPLNNVRYVKEEAMQFLVDRFGWQRVRAQALRVAVHAVLRGLLAADQVRLRQAPRPLLQPDPHEADDA
jgi:hypothetical protein